MRKSERELLELLREKGPLHIAAIEALLPHRNPAYLRTGRHRLVSIGLISCTGSAGNRFFRAVPLRVKSDDDPPLKCSVAPARSSVSSSVPSSLSGAPSRGETTKAPTATEKEEETDVRRLSSSFDTLGENDTLERVERVATIASFTRRIRLMLDELEGLAASSTSTPVIARDTPTPSLPSSSSSLRPGPEPECSPEVARAVAYLERVRRERIAAGKSKPVDSWRCWRWRVRQRLSASPEKLAEVLGDEREDQERVRRLQVAADDRARLELEARAKREAKHAEEVARDLKAAEAKARLLAKGYAV